jgi:hypothetical protein
MSNSTLTPSELAAFEKAAASDPRLAKMLEKFKTSVMESTMQSAPIADLTALCAPLGINVVIPVPKDENDKKVGPFIEFPRFGVKEDGKNPWGSPKGRYTASLGAFGALTFKKEELGKKLDGFIEHAELTLTRLKGLRDALK